MLRPQLRNWQVWDFGLLFLGLATQIYFFIWNPQRSLVGDENYYWSNALAWSKGFPLAEHPFWPPGQIRWLGMWIGLFGPSRWAIGFVQTVLHGLHAGFWSATARNGGASPSATRRIGLAIFAYPELNAFCYFLWPETLHWTLFAAAIYCLTRSQPKYSGAAGLLLGLCLWFKSYLLPFFPVLLLIQVFSRQSRRTAHFFALLLPLVLSFTCLNIWMDRTIGPGAHRGSAAFNLWLGLQDPPTREWEQPIAGTFKNTYDAWPGDWATRADRAHTEALAYIQKTGLVQTLWQLLQKKPFRLLNDRTTGQNLIPGGIHGKRAPTWVDWTMTAWLRICHWTLVLSLAWGWRSLFARNRFLALLVAGFCLTYFGLFLIFHVKTRYFLPFIPLLILKLGLDWRRPSRKHGSLALIAGVILLWVSIHGPIR